MLSRGNVCTHHVAHACDWVCVSVRMCARVCEFVHVCAHVCDGYYVAYKPITLSCILFMFIEMKFIHCHSCVMFAMKSMSMYND